MTVLLITICVLLIGIILVQIGRVTELAEKIQGEEEMQIATNKRQGIISVAFMIVFLVGCVVSAFVYKNWMLGYGPHQAASAHGGRMDTMFNITLFFTGVVFVITQIILFYFAYKYRGRKDRKATFISHNNTLEVVWTAIPAVVMAFLVINGLDAWNEIMADVGPNEEIIEVEAMGYQFAWLLRYPGADGQLGTRNYKLTSGSNPVGQDWTDLKNIDDFHPDELVLPVNKKVRVRIISRDVLHDFDLPHFRVKMDAVPGMPTYFVFTPIKTTADYREELSKYKEYQAPDPDDPTKQLWQTFEYELACAELCGNGHFSMRRIVRIVSEVEYQAWLSQQKSYYVSNIRGKDEDPFKGKLFDFEKAQGLTVAPGADTTAVSKQDTIQSTDLEADTLRKDSIEQ